MSIIYICNRKERKSQGKKLGWKISIPVILYIISIPILIFIGIMFFDFAQGVRENKEDRIHRYNNVVYDTNYLDNEIDYFND